ncbi:hypothetical protein T05_2243 [Trichinella murrelli]|uniref:Uncharacterized protein n=1 Tax=Trichinella murrelli TaxID=144512 RepID=A0A0V0T0Z2_9BILA|nr:hypothetical protein T05_2243 [Trichinella murrelli]
MKFYGENVGGVRRKIGSTLLRITTFFRNHDADYTVFVRKL